MTASGQRSWDQRPRRVIAGYRQCREALVHPAVTSNPHIAGVTTHAPQNILLLTGPEHSVLRRLVATYFSPQTALRLTRELRAGVDDLHDELRRGENEIDLLDRLIEPLVLRAIFESVGVHPGDRRAITVALRSMPGEFEPAVGSLHGSSPSMGLLRIAATLRHRAQRDRGPGLMSDLVRAASEGVISMQQAAFTLPVVLHGGYENPINYLGLLAANVATNPGRLHGASPQLRGSLIDHTLRTSGAVRGVIRWAATDLPQFGARRGDALWIDIEGANRDPQRDSRGQQHLAFGWGEHMCPGIHLTRRLASLVLMALARLPVDVLGHAEIETGKDIVTSGVRKLRVRF